MNVVLADLNSGEGVPWERSVRGRLHAMQSALASAELLREAAQSAERAQREASHTVEVARGRRWSRLTQTLLVVAALAAGAAPYVLHFV